MKLMEEEEEKEDEEWEGTKEEGGAGKGVRERKTRLVQ